MLILYSKYSLKRRFMLIFAVFF